METTDQIRAMNDAELLASVRNGDEQAFRVLAERYSGLTESAVRRFAPSFSGTEGDAAWGEDDLRQCAVLALYRAAVTYDPEGKGKEVRFGLYAKICVNNALISEVRKVRAEARRRDVRRAGHAAPLRVRRERPQVARIRRPKFLKEVFERTIAGMSVEQIAELLGKDRKSVSNALYRMKVKIKGLLRNQI